MNAPRMELTFASLIGKNKPEARVDFRRGLNVIVGPSNTGKTYIVQCIDYTLGAGTVPEDIAEARGYTTVRLGFKIRGDPREHVISRPLEGGLVTVMADRGEKLELDPRHSDDEASLSYYLLSQLGLSGREVMTKESQKRTLRFRDIAKLVVVKEQDIIDRRSPFLTDQYTNATADWNVLRLILTGVDASQVLVKVDPKIQRAREEGKRELLEEMLKNLNDQLQRHQGGEVEVRAQLSAVELEIVALNAELNAEQAAVGELENKRQSVWRELKEAESKIDVLAELQQRFELLQTQYRTDIERLEAIAEAGAVLNELPEEKCPICGALPEHHHREHTRAAPALPDVAVSCRAEAGKIQSLSRDLEATIAHNRAEIGTRRAQAVLVTERMTKLTDDLKHTLQPKLQAAAARLNGAHNQRDALRSRVANLQRAEELRQRLSLLSTTKPRTRKEKVPPKGPPEETTMLVQSMEAILRSWLFPPIGPVTFLDRNRDFSIGGRLRTSNGKGIRALTHAAATLALLKTCQQASRPFPGFVVLDSPLVVYREPDTGEADFAPKVKPAFYNAIARDFADAQVIVVENDNPPNSLEALANIIRFTGESFGRYGFIPQT